MAGNTIVNASVGGNAFGINGVQVKLIMEITSLSVNGTTFASNSGFPTTGFANAVFQVQVNNSVSQNGNFIWSSDRNWVSVDGTGKVTFTGTATSATKTVTIFARPVSGGNDLTWTFSVNKWFSNNGGAPTMLWSAASTYCTSNGTLQPTISEISVGSGNRSVGQVFSEWGPIQNYAGSGFVGGRHWTSESDGGSGHYFVYFYNGNINHLADPYEASVVCKKDI